MLFEMRRKHQERLEELEKKAELGVKRAEIRVKVARGKVTGAWLIRSYFVCSSSITIYLNNIGSVTYHSHSSRSSPAFRPILYVAICGYLLLPDLS